MNLWRDIPFVLNLFLGVLVVFPLRVSGSQIPIVNGILGGVHPRPLGIPVPGTLRYVQNSGFCETTRGVFQASGYADLSSTESMWFWFFAARQNADKAPLVIWLNGGPGSSSMLGLFQENGPCKISLDSTTVVLNPYSWNNVANMLYIDQPITVGFSHGTNTATGAKEAAQLVWQMLQIFLADPAFSHLQHNEFGIWTESYGGHYGPAFAAFFLSQNAAIKKKKIEGIHINLKTLGIGNGLTDPLIQYPGYLTYATSNPYNIETATSTQISTANTLFDEVNGCMAQIQACYKTENQATCSEAQNFCNTYMSDLYSGLNGRLNPYDIRTLYESQFQFPPPIDNFLKQPDLMTKIGAESMFTSLSTTVNQAFMMSGDWMLNNAPDLESVILDSSQVRVLIYDGDADFILNYVGVEAMVSNLKTKYTSKYNKLKWSDFVVSGVKAGQFKQLGTFGYLRVYGAGHQVPAYGWQDLPPGEAALQFFTYIINGNKLSRGFSLAPNTPMVTWAVIMLMGFALSMVVGLDVGF
ncbi:serine carboxypeptidase [Sistotremastrum niveocremeum HHB9708]|uniref:Carboxypeptidase n=1 Tax=Sistotremastrum niveocremeum HHB9708 TaxID=1314777 RepID=A0A164RT84_9AGAM|nr:serine carboxypeptidase [Sistotremastrum niveocremeum HHB9708]